MTSKNIFFSKYRGDQLFSKGFLFSRKMKPFLLAEFNQLFSIVYFCLKRMESILWCARFGWGKISAPLPCMPPWIGYVYLCRCVPPHAVEGKIWAHQQFKGTEQSKNENFYFLAPVQRNWVIPNLPVVQCAAWSNLDQFFLANCS